MCIYIYILYVYMWPSTYCSNFIHSPIHVVMSCHVISKHSFLDLDSHQPHKNLEQDKDYGLGGSRYQYYINHKYVLYRSRGNETNPLPQKADSIQRSPSRESHNAKSARFQQDPGPKLHPWSHRKHKMSQPEKNWGKVLKRYINMILLRYTGTCFPCRIIYTKNSSRLFLCVSIFLGFKWSWASLL